MPTRYAHASSQTNAVQKCEVAVQAGQHAISTNLPYTPEGQDVCYGDTERFHKNFTLEYDGFETYEAGTATNTTGGYSTQIVQTPQEKNWKKATKPTVHQAVVTPSPSTSIKRPAGGSVSRKRKITHTHIY